MPNSGRLDQILLDILYKTEYLIQWVWQKNYSAQTTNLHIYILDAVPPVHVVWNHVDTDKFTTANGGTFTSSSASRSNQSQ